MGARHSRDGRRGGLRPREGGSKIADVSKRRSAKKEAEAAEKGKGILDPLAKHQTPEQTWDDPGRRKEVHAMADKVAQETARTHATQRL